VCESLIACHLGKIVGIDGFLHGFAWDVLVDDVLEGKDAQVVLHRIGFAPSPEHLDEQRLRRWSNLLFLIDQMLVLLAVRLHVRNIGSLGSTEDVAEIGTDGSHQGGLGIG